MTMIIADLVIQREVQVAAQTMKKTYNEKKLLAMGCSLLAYEIYPGHSIQKQSIFKPDKMKPINLTQSNHYQKPMAKGK